MKGFKYILISSMVILPLMATACSSQVASGQDALTEGKARQKAEQFVRQSPTFAFDGMEETLVLTETLYPDIENAWTFVFEFESRQYGYGDRTGQMLLEVITPHEAMVTIEQGQVISAVMDGVWDMLAQELISDQGNG